MSSDFRRRGLGTEMQHALLHLAFHGFWAAEAHSEAAVSNVASSAISEQVGDVPV